MAKAVFGLVDSESQAERIVDSFKTAGFPNNDISVLFPDKGGTRDFAHEKNTKAPEGAATGAGVGGVAGGVLGWLVGIGSLAIPGRGPFIAGGPLMAGVRGGRTRVAARPWFLGYPRRRTVYCRRTDYGRSGGSRCGRGGRWAFGSVSWNGYSGVGSRAVRGKNQKRA